jgi:predicted Na+-dependent transporter
MKSITTSGLRFIENHFGFVMVLFCLAGLFMPGLSRLPNSSVAVALAVLMFVSCYRWRDGGAGRGVWRDVGIFYLLRYGLLPTAIWWVLHRFAPELATGAFLLSVVPAAVSGPVFTSMYGGSMSVAFAIVLLSQFLAPWGF